MNTSWYRKEMGDGIAAFAPSQRLPDLYMALAAAGIDYRPVAVFCQEESGVQVWYFTPEARILADQFGAVPCEKPKSKGMSLLIGDHGAWEHFPRPKWDEKVNY